MLTRSKKKNKKKIGSRKLSDKKLKAARRQRRIEASRQKNRVQGLNEKLLLKTSKSIFGGLLHHKQVLSIALVTLGVVYTVRMTIHGIGAALAKSRGHGCTKHGIKQIDRFMSNKKIRPVDMRLGLVRAVVGNRKHIDISMDWTDFDKDDQTTLALSFIMKHGRAIPLVWLTARKSRLKNNQSLYEKTAVQMLTDALPPGVMVTLVADRGFGNTPFFDFLNEMPNFHFVIRFKQGFLVEANGYSGKAASAVFKNGRIRVLKNAKLTSSKKGPYNVVLYKAAKMKDAWCLATNLKTQNGEDIVKKYSRRFECEESFRDLKDWRFGLALKHTNIKNENRRGRLLFAFSLAAYLLTLVGIVSERNGYDKWLRANTSQKRTHSLFRQGREIVSRALPNVLEGHCFRDVGRLVNIALKRGFCHAMS